MERSARIKYATFESALQYGQISEEPVFDGPKHYLKIKGCMGFEN